MFSTVCALCCDRKTQKRHIKHVPGAQFDGPRHTEHERHERHTEAAPRNNRKTFSQHMAATVAEVSKSFANGADLEEKKNQEYRKQVKEIKAIARRLEGQVQKYPRSGKGLLKKMQDRYIAVIPHDSTGNWSSMDSGSAAEDKKDSPDKLELSRWKGGHLAYWEFSSEFKSGAAPKGVVPLLKIAKVAVSKDDSRGRSVLVKHKMSSEMCELVLCFPSKRDAEEWSYMLWDLISKLRGYATVPPSGVSLDFSNSDRSSVF